MERKKKSSPARAAQQQSSAEAATTSEQVPAQSGSQTPPEAQASRARSAAPGTPGRSASRPRFQEHAPQQSGPAESTPQTAASFQSQQTLSVPTLHVSPPDSSPTFQRTLFESTGPQQPPLQSHAIEHYMIPPDQLQQPLFPFASPQPDFFQQQLQYQSDSSGQMYFGFSQAQPRPYQHTLHQLRSPAPPLQPAPPEPHLSPPYQLRPTRFQVASPQSRVRVNLFGPIQPQPQYQPISPELAYRGHNLALLQPDQHTIYQPRQTSFTRAMSAPPRERIRPTSSISQSTPIQLATAHDQYLSPDRLHQFRSQEASSQSRGLGYSVGSSQLQIPYQTTSSGHAYRGYNLALLQPDQYTIYQPRQTSSTRATSAPPSDRIRPTSPIPQPAPIQLTAPVNLLPLQGEPRIRGPRARSPISPGQTQPPKVPRATAESSVSRPSTSPRMSYPFSFQPGTISGEPSISGTPQQTIQSVTSFWGSGLQQHQFEPQPGPSGLASHHQLTTHGPPICGISGSVEPMMTETSQLEPSRLAPGSVEPMLTEMSPPEPSRLVPGSARRSQRKKSAETCRYTIPNKVPGGSVNHVPVKVLCNYYPMTLFPTELIRYDISFKPDKPKKLVKVAYDKMKRDLFPRAVMAFDQSKICIVREPLPGVGERFVTNMEIRDENQRTVNFEVTIIHTGVLNFNTLIEYTRKPTTSLNPPTEVIQLLDIILRQGTLESYTKAGRQFFKRPHHPVDLGHGLEMWTGLFQSAIITNRMFINVDVAHKGFPKANNLVVLLIEDFSITSKDGKQKELEKQQNNEKFLEFLKGLRVVVPIHSEGSRGEKRYEREFIVNSLEGPPNTESFDYTNAEGATKKITILDYFQQVKGVNIQYPNLNCVSVGSKEKKILYPMELVSVASGQVRNKQPNEEQLSKMVQIAASPPEIRINKIKEIIKEVKYSSNVNLQHFGLKINDSNFHTVSGKMVGSPKIDSGRILQPTAGSWRCDTLFKPVAFPSWVFFSVEVDSKNPTEFIENLIKEGGNLGMTIGAPASEYIGKKELLAEKLLHYMGRGCKLAFVVIPQKQDIYHYIKRVAECDIGILTQCVKWNTFDKAKRVTQQAKNTIKNILLKVNAKLMGINHKIYYECVPKSLDVSDRVMVVGADVTHPSPDQLQRPVPSLAAVVASIHNSHTIYNLEMSIQAARVEIILQFQEMMRDHFEIYKSYNGNLPTKIYVYRDGVSEGQFSQVLNEELDALYEAYSSAGGRERPQVLFLVVQKRHHTRLFHEARLKESKPQERNVLPGTLVDEDIVHPTELDFYMVSHQAIKGTARPTRYHQLFNSTDLKTNDVQQLTYYLCYLFARCTRSVSYPAPTYYAHLACLRARSLTYNKEINMDCLPVRLRVHESLKSQSTMFFV